MSTLLIDIGNTRIKWRVIDANRPDAPDAEQSLDLAWRGTGGALALAEIDQLARHWQAAAVDRMDAALVSNVASPDVGASVGKAVAATWPAIRLESVQSSAARGGIVNGYAEPERLGSDRWLAMIGGHHLLPDSSLLICSLGTATTIDLVAIDKAHPTVQARFVGGLILPGVDAMRRALAASTARLPEGEQGRPVDFADNTADAITSGILGAQVGAVERAWRDATSRVGGDTLTCLVAGGSAPAISAALATLGIRYRVVPDLVLRGLAVVAREGR